MAPDITECINCELIYTTVLRHSSKDVLFGYGIDVHLFFMFITEAISLIIEIESSAFKSKELQKIPPIVTFQRLLIITERFT